jgi:hypothetical protein
MRIDPEDLRRHYELLSDEGLLDIDRSDLAPVAQGIYDHEITRRGLDHPPEQEVEAYHYPLPIFKAGADRDFASELRADTDDGPPPAWLEDAACPWSAYIYPNGDYMVTGAEVQTVLRDAGIPNRIVVKPPEPEAEPPSMSRSLYCVMVPGDRGTHACSVVERKVFNRIAEAEWRSQLQAFSDEELRALNPEDFWGALLDRAERMKRAYVDEIARRMLPPAAR